MGKAVSSGAGTDLGKEDTKTQAGIRTLPRTAAPTSRLASPWVFIAGMSKSGSHGGNDSNVCKGAISLTSHPSFCIASDGKLSPSSPGTSLLQVCSCQISGMSLQEEARRGGRSAGQPGFLLLPCACPTAASKVAQLSSRVVIDISEGRKLASEGSANFHV